MNDGAVAIRLVSTPTVLSGALWPPHESAPLTEADAAGASCRHALAAISAVSHQPAHSAAAFGPAASVRTIEKTMDRYTENPVVERARTAPSWVLDIPPKGGVSRRALRGIPRPDANIPAPAIPWAHAHFHSSCPHLSVRAGPRRATAEARSARTHAAQV